MGPECACMVLRTMWWNRKPFRSLHVHSLRKCAGKHQIWHTGQKYTVEHIQKQRTQFWRCNNYVHKCYTKTRFTVQIYLCIIYLIGERDWKYHLDFILGLLALGVTKRCRLSWLSNSALVYGPNAGGGDAGSQPMSTAVQRSPSPTKRWRSNSIFNLWPVSYGVK
jgi:hypothetical protein